MEENYRADIDGLRAIAVAFVVLYHAGYSWASGGYIGVDIFFVISGYLITRIIAEQLSEGKFSLSNFYKRRLARIIPTLSIVIISSYIAGYYLLLPEDFVSLSEEIKASSLFYANFHFMWKGGYFDAPIESNHLLHMWSLAVEEQFYIAIPILLALFWRFTRLPLRWLLAICMLVSFVYSEILLNNGLEQRAFFDPFSRSWELLAGATLSLFHINKKKVQSPRYSNAISVIGILLLSYCFTEYSEVTRFPGVYSAIPVIGTVLIIHTAGSKGNFIGLVLSLSPARLLGMISYSLYLWHWPLFSYFNYYNIVPISDIQRALLVTASIILAYISWTFIENPTRRMGYRLPSIKVSVAGVLALLAPLAVSIHVENRQGIPERFSEDIHTLLSAKNDSPSFSECEIISIYDTNLKKCIINQNIETGPAFILWGDSHGEALLPAAEKAASDLGINGVAITQPGCPTIIGVNQVREGYRDCSEKAVAVLEYIRQTPSIQHVIIASRWALYATGSRYKAEPGNPVKLVSQQERYHSLDNETLVINGLGEALQKLRDQSLDVTVIEQVPEVETDVPRSLALSSHFGKDISLAPLVHDYDIRQSIIRKALAQLKQEYPEIVIGRPSEVLCNNETCIIEANGVPLYRDTNHLTVQGAIMLSPLFASILR